MLFILNKQISEVKNAQCEHAAAKALDRHRSLQAKARVRRLLSSKKGLTTAFVAGMIKGTSASSKQSASNFSSLIIKQGLLTWLGSSATNEASSSGADPTE